MKVREIFFMNAEQIIIRKRDGNELSEQELQFIIEGFVNGEIPDYQMVALLMTIYFQGMSYEETFLLTKQMIESGKKLDFSQLDKFPIDKHSTGGVGDKVSIILAPLVAAAGVAVPMISGRALGHSGGTLDKLEAIPGFRTRLTLTEFVVQVEKIGVAMIGQTDEIVPADRKIYALRDRTGTIPSIPLVVASILSKKVAEGVKALVLDVKTGKGAFFSSKDKALKLAETIIAISQKFGLHTTALMTTMDQPLGYAVGNWLETREAIDTLKGNGPRDVVDITLALGAEMLIQARLVDNVISGQNKLRHLLETGNAYEKFLTLVEAQGGDVSIIENPDRYPKSEYQLTIFSENEGYIHSINALRVGLLAMEIGAGRKKISDQIDYGAGIVLQKKVGNSVSKGEPLAEIFCSKKISSKCIQEQFSTVIEIRDEPKPPSPLILKYISKKSQFDWNHIAKN
ncbi:MAG: thymidine phosphorylase [bacterium]|nr:MAG: thymidine phosphorylase [bacterium]